MSVDKFERGDLQILTTFVDQDIWKKVRQLMVFARDVAAHLIPSAGRQATPLPYPGTWTQTQILWDWTYCYDRKLGWYLGWGFSGEYGLRDLGVHSARTFTGFRSFDKRPFRFCRRLTLRLVPKYRGRSRSFACSPHDRFVTADTMKRVPCHNNACQTDLASSMSNPLR
jgi:hypothetical protein